MIVAAIIAAAVIQADWQQEGRPTRDLDRPDVYDGE
jgi:hypothetical protein